MAYDKSTHFPKLNDVNYVEWSIRMEAELTRRQLWSMIEIVVDEDGKEDEKIAEAMTKKKKKKRSTARIRVMTRISERKQMNDVVGYQWLVCN